MRKQPVFHAAHEDDRKLEPFRGVQRHHLHAVLPRLGLTLAGLQHRMREERLERWQLARLALGLEAARGGHELVEVLDACLAALGLLSPVMIDEPAALQDVIHLLVQAEVLDLAGESLDEIQEALQRGDRPGAKFFVALRCR